MDALFIFKGYPQLHALDLDLAFPFMLEDAFVWLPMLWRRRVPSRVAVLVWILGSKMRKIANDIAACSTENVLIIVSDDNTACLPAAGRRQSDPIVHDGWFVRIERGSVCDDEHPRQSTAAQPHGSPFISSIQC